MKQQRKVKIQPLQPAIPHETVASPPEAPEENPPAKQTAEQRVAELEAETAKLRQALDEVQRANAALASQRTSEEQKARTLSTLLAQQQAHLLAYPALVDSAGRPPVFVGFLPTGEIRAGGDYAQIEQMLAAQPGSQGPFVMRLQIPF